MLNRYLLRFTYAIRYRDRPFVLSADCQRCSCLLIVRARLVQLELIGAIDQTLVFLCYRCSVYRHALRDLQMSHILRVRVRQDLCDRNMIPVQDRVSFSGNFQRISRDCCPVRFFSYSVCAKRKSADCHSCFIVCRHINRDLRIAQRSILLHILGLLFSAFCYLRCYCRFVILRQCLSARSDYRLLQRQLAILCFLVDNRYCIAVEVLVRRDV